MSRNINTTNILDELAASFFRINPDSFVYSEDDRDAVNSDHCENFKCLVYFVGSNYTAYITDG
jgi:hypothetical protein